MTLLIAASVLTNYRNQLELHGLPVRETVAALGYDPSTFLSHHIHAAEKNLRSLAPEEPAVFDIPPQRLDGSVGTYPTEDLRSIDPREAFDKPPRRDNDPSP